MRLTAFSAASLCLWACCDASPLELNRERSQQDNTAPEPALSSLLAVTPTATPSSVAHASRALSSIFAAKPTPNTLLEIATDLVEAGLTPQNPSNLVEFLAGLVDGENSKNNVNLRRPRQTIYPKAGKNDAPYDLTEEQLRSVIYIPSTFKYGSGAQPAILVPGTGDTGYTTFAGNYIPLLQHSSVADPVWLNIPGYLLGDAQTSAEYVAYAINYISSITARKVAVISWSQGAIDAQWAYKYWPSTREKVTDHVAFSPDYHGTVLANLVGAPNEPLPPSFLQQDYNSNFIKTLRANGGDEAYVPTTTIYSGFFDEIVEPQQGKGASAYLLNSASRGVKATNHEVQLVCKGQPAGTFYTHEGVLYNALGYALLVDALTHAGPGQTSRLKLNKICQNYLTPGLDLADLLLTENSILVAGIATGVYPGKMIAEPPIKAYARH